MTVIVQEGNVGHVTAVPAVLVARGLRERVKSGKSTELVPSNYYRLFK